MTQPRRRRSWPFALIGGVVALAGCQTTGESGVEAEYSRLRSVGGFSVTQSSPKRAVFTVKGQKIVVEPPKGYCLDPDSVDVTGRAAFALIADCLETRLPEIAQEDGEGEVVAIDLPRSFPGILTVSISGEPAYGQGAGALDEFEALISGENGLQLLSRGKANKAGRIAATRRIGGALYVLVEEAQSGGHSFLAPRFWRAFIDIRSRLVLVTVSSFSDRPVAEDAMMGFLAQQLVRLRRVNGLPADTEEGQIARQMEASLDIAVADAGGMTVVRSETPAEISDGVDPARAPLPPGRRIASAETALAAPNRATGRAPSRAPVAPQRPG